MDSLFQTRIDSIEPLIDRAESLRARAKRLRLRIDTLSNAISELDKARITGGTFLVRDLYEDPLGAESARPPRRYRFSPPPSFVDSTSLVHNSAYVSTGTGQRLREWKNQLIQANKELDTLESQLLEADQRVASQDTLLVGLLNGKLDGELLRVEFRGGVYRIFIATSAKHKVQIHDNRSGKLQPLQYTWDILQQMQHTPLLLMNGGMYLPDGAPVGLLVENQRLIHPLNRDSLPTADNFHLYPNGVFGCEQNGRFFVWKSREFERLYPVPYTSISQATQSGPMLVIDSDIHRSFNYGSPNTNIRNGVGIVKGSNRTRAIFVLSENRINLYDFALLFKSILKCDQALYLDGVISKMYVQVGDKRTGDLGGSLGPVISLIKK